MRLALTLLLTLLLAPSHAGIRSYQANLDNAEWQLAEATPLRCELRHQIPGFGSARFISDASKQLNLRFSLQMLRKPDAATPVLLKSVPPAWRPGHSTLPITELTFYRQFDGELGKQDAWLMLNELERGMQPTFYYQDWQDKQTVEVGLSSVKFAPRFVEFSACLDQLLPYGFDDIAFTVLHHDKYGELTAHSLQQLQRVVNYLSLDPLLEVVLMDFYTDAYGTESTNNALTRQQAQSLKEKLIANGIPEQRITATAHGEKRHVAGNDSEFGRQLNRRVVMRIEPF
ncbi:OmpA family protein [Ferrimonas senticii]|uniref:OmpA family protein n=1 Tax=Ferrimonas senticii TaxID=394566 RepID=UPI00041DE4C8|nr:OmpA family protein [Ferrimonas senticii]